MGLFSRSHNNGVAEQFEQIFKAGEKMTEQEFLDHLNVIVRAVDIDRTYTTNQKLKSYELLSQISNCSAADRHNYAQKLVKALR